MMLTLISAATAAVTAILNAVVLLGWWDLSTEQISGITVAVVAVGSLVHTIVNPNVPIGNTNP